MDLDVITVGGGLAGAALAAKMARAGQKVLVLERETRFKDRVRGENMLPWGVAAARRLGMVEPLLGAGAHPAGSWIMYAGGHPVSQRDLRATTPFGESCLNIYHPDLQETLLQRAAEAGADVRRGASAVGLEAGPGRDPSVAFEHQGQRHSASARVVVGADGRNSQVRAWAGFDQRRDPDLLMIAGILLEDSGVPDEAVHLAFGEGCAMLMAPLGRRRVRSYFVYPGIPGPRGLSGPHKFGEFIQACRASGMPEEWFAKTQPAGPLAEFSGADRWVESPARHGVVLIGDAAASTDPSWGCGLSLTLLDCENLANALCAGGNREEALARYSAGHAEYYGALHRILGWMTELMWTPGPEGEERRQRVFPRMTSDPRGFPDSIGMGPFGPSGEEARRLVLGLGGERKSAPAH